MFLPVNEKAKSEAIIFPILKEVWRSNRDKIACFSGFTLETTHNKKLSGMCDYIFGHAPQSIELNAPAFCVVEAKNRTLEEGFGQCIAEMYAVELFNEERGNPIPVVYGLVTNAYEWIFLKYENKLATIDLNRYFSTNSDNLSHLLGVFQWIVDRI
jgi:hypothetical protein